MPICPATKAYCRCQSEMMHEATSRTGSLKTDTGRPHAWPGFHQPHGIKVPFGTQVRHTARHAKSQTAFGSPCCSSDVPLCTDPQQDAETVWNTTSTLSDFTHNAQHPLTQHPALGHTQHFSACTNAHYTSTHTAQYPSQNAPSLQTQDH
jgi:hypothetical protein